MYIDGAHTVFLQGCVESCMAMHEAVPQKLASEQDNTHRGTETQVRKSICFPLMTVGAQTQQANCGTQERQ
eukprot:7322289-Ditylum_brightwellii.AAC.1